ncbi:hypothetical protein KAU11_10680 [Candidatus Babeliales bacterium]|nr:hypothetical protein [Candidatus Babeliales bacterium]
MIYYISDRNNIAKDAKVARITELEAYNALKDNTLLYEDTETFTLDFLKANPLKLLQIGDGVNEYIFDVRSIEIPNIKKLLEDPKIIKVLVNLYFERNMLKSIGVDLRGGFDLSLAYASYRMGRELRFIEIEDHKAFIYSFAGMYYNLLGVVIDKEQQTTFIGEGEHYTNAQLIYAARDVQIEDLYTKMCEICIKRGILHKDFNLWEGAEIQLKKGIYKMLTLEMQAANVFADMMYNGINIDKDQWLDIHERNKVRLFTTEKNLNLSLVKRLPEYKGIRTEPFKDNISKQYDIFGNLIIQEHAKKDSKRINWNSSPKKKEIVSRMFGKVPISKEGKETVGIKDLEKFNASLKDPFIYLLMDRGKLSKRISSFGRNYLDSHIHPISGRIHPSINQILETGRIAWYKPNLAQIPGSKEYRDCFVPPLGFDLVACDYSGQESRIMAFLSGDTEFIDFFENGDGDSHSMVASKVYSKKYNKEIQVSKTRLVISHFVTDLNEVETLCKQLFPKADKLTVTKTTVIVESSIGDKNPLRQYGKVLNFFISFGGSAYTLSTDQGISREEANGLIQGYWSAFKELKLFFDEEKKKALSQGYIISEPITGTRRNLPKHRDMVIERNKLKVIKEDLIEKYGDKRGTNIYFQQAKTKGSEINTYSGRMFRLKGDIERAAMNSRIQTTASRMTKLGAILIEEEVRKRKLRIRPVNFVHDELLYEIPEDTNYEELIQRGMEKASILLVGKLIPAVPEKGKQWIH